jgi:diguanylate cyclase (GGDEF)-like protein
MNLLGFLFALAPPALLAAGALALVAEPSLIPPPAAELMPQMPYAAAVIATALGLVFHRGRVVFTAIGAAIAYAALQSVIAPNEDISARAAFAGLCFLAPIVVVAIAWLEERRTANIHSLARVALLAGAVAVSIWIADRTETLERAYAPIIAPLSFATPIPQLGLIVLGGSVVAVAVAAAVRRSVVIASLAWALAALAFALHSWTRPLDVAIAMTVASAALALAVLQESYRMAFRDELTGLPGRRALNEALQAVGRRYAIAMVDVDHFKKLNDTHGHDVGDQVLRLVATRLARVGGGGRAFRYGGEEFSVLFPGKTAAEATPHMEALRAGIADYQMTVRSANRPWLSRMGKRHRGETTIAPTLAVTVTVSVGIAERVGRSASPETVIRAADRALYRAKRSGRNRLYATREG